jgi:hypothetical protein
MVVTNFALAALSLCLVLDSTLAQDVPTRVVDDEAATPLDEKAWTPVDIPLFYMTLYVLKLASTSLTDYSVVLSSSDM